MNLLMKNIGILVVFLATVFLSTKSIWAKLIYLDSLSPLNVLVCRAVLSLPFFLIPMIRFDWNSVNKSKVFKYSFFGAILYLSSSIADFIGLLYISASLERAVLFTFPIYVFLLSSDLSRITFSKVVLIVSTVLGLAIMFNPTVDNHLTDTLIGISLVLLSAIFWALFIIYSKRAVSNISPTIFTSTYMCITTVLLLLGFIIDSKNFTTFSTLQTHTMIYLVFLAIFCSIIPSYLMSFGLKRINASLAAVISAMGPIVTLALDVVILNHNLALNEIIGAIIVTACVTCLTRLNAKA
ncbi:MAG: DMT family transporter [Veillonella parvula]|uniref:DMT family transporter n=5 Tax=root TaxID=1 RepID=A0A942WLR4_VEIPA|nr:DMT family transporter [Veillonella sp.]EFB86327.1 putative membrane protein [Veillonella parvula ATCC 17745]EGL77383.1 membrane protein [Veillonella parvula ACS-068-V-Sch12]MBS4892971.1 DMT family transporter [Veillonella parvula]MBS5179461.1 DMT family transporter [Veillonella sp.]MBS5352425.1 DMT family transporter [Veillonella sp.]